MNSASNDGCGQAGAGSVARSPSAESGGLRAWALRTYARCNAWGLARAGRAWLPRYLGPIFPGAVAHHRPPGWRGVLFGHGPGFFRATVVEGHAASAYFRNAGVTACAEQNGGICTFRLGREIALYQVDNRPLVEDECLAPSTGPNRNLFGEFMGTLESGDPRRSEKRRIIESTMGSARFVEGLQPAIRDCTREFFAATRGEQPLDDFLRRLVARVESCVPGLLDLCQVPLDVYLASDEFGVVARDYFDIASDVISKMHAGAVVDFDGIVPFVRAVLADNFDSLAEAGETNMIRRHFRLWRLPFTRAAVADLDTDKIKELGTVLVAIYDTTYLSLHWAIGYVESDPVLKSRVIAEAKRAPVPGALGLIDQVVLEAVRLGGSNPTALWRRVVRPFELCHRGRRVTVPPGVMLWLDRQRANRDPALFPEPARFDPDNIRGIVRPGRESLSSLLSRTRYEINSFSMVNTERNPRKCPGRLLSVYLQSILLAELYGAYEVHVAGLDLALRRHSSMPRPASAGTIRISPLLQANREHAS